jgi:hypothetical protein
MTSHWAIKFCTSSAKQIDVSNATWNNTQPYGSTAKMNTAGAVCARQKCNDAQNSRQQHAAQLAAE